MNSNGSFYASMFFSLISFCSIWNKEKFLESKAQPLILKEFSLLTHLKYPLS